MRALAVLIASLALAACGSPPRPAMLPVLPPLASHVVRPAAGNGGRSWDGVVEAVQQADLAAQTAGRVTVVNIDVNDHVPAGAVLLRLTAVEQQAGANTARAQLRAAEAAAAEAQASFKRYAALAPGQFVSRAQLDQVRAARDSAIATRDAARAQLAQAGQQADYTVVHAPFAGVVSARRVEPGETVAPGQPLLSIYAPGALRIEVQVPQSDAAAIRATPRATVVLEDGRRIDAADVVVFPSADPATHSVGVRVLLPDLQAAPQPGVTAKVVFPIPVPMQVDAVRIPRSALVQRGEISGVYVIDGNRIALRQLRLGPVGDSDVEVLAGLQPGERVALDPVAAVQALVAQREAAGHAND